MRRERFVVFALLLLLLSPVAAPETEARAQSSSAPEEGTSGGASDEAFFETVDVNVVNVEVYVRDKKGNPIKGLTKDDFIIEEDGRPVTVTNFYVMEEGSPVGADGEIEMLPATVPGMAPLPRIPEEQRLNLIVYIDNFNIRPFNRNRVIRRVRTFLNDKLDHNDRVMLVSYDRSLKVRHPFTSDPNLIAGSLFELEKMTGHALHQDSERAEILRAIEEADSMSEVEWRVRQFAESEFNDLSFTIDAMRELVDSLAGLNGRKAILYVSDGLAMKPGDDLFHALVQKFRESSILTRSNDYMASRRFQELVAQANTNRISFYTIDAAGLRVSSSSLAERATISQAGYESLVDSMYIHNMQSTIRMIAEDTGGFAIFNTNDPSVGLGRIATDFRTYYSLGYNSSSADDGRYHKIKVSLRKKDKSIRLRHREGYRGKSLSTRMADGTTSTLLYGFERNPLSVAVRFGQGSRQEGGHFMVPMVVEVPIGKIVLVPREEFHQGKVKLFFSALDDKGRSADVQEVPVDIRIPVAEVDVARTKNYYYSVNLQMRAGRQRIAVGVRDEIGAVESFVSKAVDVTG